MRERQEHLRRADVEQVVDPAIEQPSLLWRVSQTTVVDSAKAEGLHAAVVDAPEDREGRGRDEGPLRQENRHEEQNWDDGEANTMAGENRRIAVAAKEDRPEVCPCETVDQERDLALIAR